MSWRKFFPHDSPRPEQERALDEACEWMSGRGRFMAMELPTGVGKSAVAVTISRMLASLDRRTYVVTSQKILQDQYKRDFDVPDIRSSSDYRCKSASLSCGEYSRMRAAIDAPPCAACPYRKAKERFVTSHYGVTNYSYLLSESTYAGQLTGRDLLILDEAHNVEKEVRSWATVLVSEEWAMRELRLPMPRVPDRELFKWVMSDYRDSVAHAKDRTESDMATAASRKNNRVAAALSKKFSFLDQHLCGIERLSSVGFDGTSMKWDGKALVLKPFDVSSMIGASLYSLGKRVLLMSATMLDREEFFRSAAVPPTGRYLSVPSPFPKQAYGVKYYPVAKVTRYGLDDVGRERLVAGVRAVLRDNPDSKGIIHTANYDLLRTLKEALGSDPRMLWQDTSADRVRILDLHQTSKGPTVLVSPGMTEGVDLRDDLSRFQVLLKVPWPSLGDPIVDHLSTERPRWYAWSTAKTLVQSAGRSVRSTEDWARTYILDASYGKFIQQWGEMLPDWIKP